MLGLYALVISGGFLVTAVSLWALCILAPWLGLVDHPHGRKDHRKPTPVVGGLAIFMGWGCAILCALVLQLHVDAIIGNLRTHVGFALAATLLVVVGAADDWRPVPARYKLAAQIVACFLAVGLDNAIVGSVPLALGLGVLEIPSGLVAPFTVLVMLTIINAINMIDGLDGLAAGMTFVALAIMAKALTTAGFSGAPFLLALVGSMAAFLLVNFPLLKSRPALVFLGDAGSLLCGFVLAYMAIQLSSAPNRVFKPSTALWLFFIPVADTIWIYLRRMWVARAPFAPGRDHIHHLLLEHMSARLVTWVLVSLSALMAAGAYAAERRGAQSLVLIGLWIVAFLIYGALTHRPWKAAWAKSRAAQAELEKSGVAF